jgi:uncharacterized protein YacL
VCDSGADRVVPFPVERVGFQDFVDGSHAVIAYLPLVFIAIIIAITAAAVAAAVKALIENSLSGLSYAKILGNAASGLILALGLVAALDQLHIATNVVNAVLYAALAAIVGILVIAVGGGGIKTMSARWESAATRYDQEKPRIAEAARNAPSVKDQARQAKNITQQKTGASQQQANSARHGRPGTTAAEADSWH